MTESASLKTLWQKSFPDLETAAGDPGLSYRPGSLSSTATILLDTLSGDDRPEPEEAPPTRPGLPDHRLLARIGEGGMGLVYRARQLSLQREVAVKTFKRQGQDQARQAFLAEARVTAVLDHPNIVPVHELHEQGEELYLSMKLVGGQPWSERLAQDKPWANPDKLDEHLEVLLSVGNAVAFAHSRGIVHLDLKPDNVMLGEYGEVLVLDWGLARELEPGQGRAGLASDLKEPCGTPRYMAPELARGKGSELGPWTDVYLLGACLYEVLSGRPPHGGRDLFEVLNAAVGEGPEAPEGAPRELSELAGRALARAAEERPSSAEAFQASLRDYRRHRESARLSEAAWGDLEAAGTSSGRGRYDALAGAIASFEQSLKLWGENKQAVEGRSAARRRYAEEALESGDLLLAETQIAALGACAAREELSGRLSAARSAEAARARRSRWQRRGLAAAALIIVAVVAVAFAINRRARIDAQLEKDKAREAEAEAKLSASEAEQQTEKARAAEAEARASAREAVHQSMRAKAALQSAERNLTEAFRQAGGYALSRGEGIHAGVYLSRALVSEDRRSTRSRLLNARLSSPTRLWSRRVAAGPKALRFDHEDRRLALAWSEGEGAEARRRVALFDAASGEPRGGIAGVGSGALTSFAFDPKDPDKLYAVGAGALERWSLKSGRAEERWPFGAEPFLRPSALVASVETGWPVGMVEGRCVWAFDPRAGEVALNIAAEGVQDIDALARFPGVILSTSSLLARMNIAERALQTFPTFERPLNAPAEARYLSAASANGRWFAAASRTEVKLWRSSADGKHNLVVGSFLFSESLDVEMLGQDRTDDWIQGLSMSADGGLVLAYGGDERALRIWDGERGKIALSIPGRGRRLLMAAFGRSSASLVTVWEDAGAAVVEAWGLGQRAITSPMGRGTVSGLAAVPGTRDFLALYLGGLFRWSPDLNSWSLVTETADASALAISADGARIAVSESDGISLRAADTGEVLRRFPQEHALYAQRPGGMPEGYKDVLFDFTDKLIDEAIRRSEAQSGQEKVLGELLKAEFLKALAPGGNTEVNKSFRDIIKLTYNYKALAFVEDGAKLAAFGVGEIHLIDLESGATKTLLVTRPQDLIPSLGLLVALDSSGQRLATLQRGAMFQERLLSGKLGMASLVVRERATGEKIGGGDAPFALATDLRFSPENRQLALVAERHLSLWSADGTPRLGVKLAASGAGHAGRVLCCAFLSEEILATGGMKGEVCFWDTRDGRFLGRFQAFPGLISTLKRSPDGAYLFAADIRGAIRRWDAHLIERALTADPAELFEDAKKYSGLRLEGLRLVPARAGE